MFIPQRLNLIQLIQALEIQKPDTTVRFDFGGCVPTELHSYRGYYHDLAIGFSDVGRPPTVTEFVKQLRSAIGDTFHGFKGGEFTMHEHTNIWVANRGVSSSTGVFALFGDDIETVIQTGWSP